MKKKILGVFLVFVLVLAVGCAGKKNNAAEPSPNVEETMTTYSPKPLLETDSPQPTLLPTVEPVHSISIKIYKINDSATTISLKKTNKVTADKLNAALINICKNEYGILVDSIYKNGDITVVNWNKKMISVLNTSGSAGADSMLTKFLKTMFSVEGINKVKININGDKKAVGDLYDFSSSFTIKDISKNFIEK